MKQFLIAFLVFLSVSVSTQTYVKIADRPEYKKYSDYCDRLVPTFAFQIGKANVDWSTYLPIDSAIHMGISLVEYSKYEYHKPASDTIVTLRIVDPIDIKWDRNVSLKREVKWGLVVHIKTATDTATYVHPMTINWMTPIIPKYAEDADPNKILNEYSMTGMQLVVPSVFVVFVSQRKHTIADFYNWWMKLTVKPE